MKSLGQRTWLLKCTEGKRAQGRPSDEPWEPMHFVRLNSYNINTKAL